jgi:hypothetical protein
VPTFLSDPTTGLYLVLIAIPVVAAVPLARSQDRKSLRRFLLGCVPIVLVFLIDWLVESPREEATRRVLAMADAATRVDPAGFVEHVSPSFNVNGKGKEQLKSSPVWNQIRAYNARVAVWGFGHDAYERVGDNEIEVGFYAKGEAASGVLLRYCRARFVEDPDGQYRLRGIRFYDPAGRGLNAEEPIPGFP